MSLISPGAALITVSDVRLMQEVTIEEEPAVQMLINSVQSLFESLTHRLWGYRHDYEKIYNFDTARKRSKPKIWVPLMPINMNGSTPRITVTGWNFGENQTQASTYILNDDYTVIPSRGFIHLDDYAGWKYWISIKMTGGYASPDLDQTSFVGSPPEPPEDVKLGLTRQVVYHRLRYGGDKSILRDQSVGGQTSRLKEDVHDPFFLDIVRTYKRYGYFHNG